MLLNEVRHRKSVSKLFFIFLMGCPFVSETERERQRVKVRERVCVCVRDRECVCVCVRAHMRVHACMYMFCIHVYL